MLPVRELHQTGVVTSAIGFGCAGLFRIPDRKTRMAMLGSAYDAGIRHFDTAPMYGLGLAEAELGVFLHRRREDVTVTTKFGIDPSIIARVLAPLQKPARAFLARKPTLNEGLRTVGKDNKSGTVGRFFYTTHGYHAHAAQESLERSLRALRTDYIDIFLLHDPVGGLVTDASGLADYLEEQCKKGRIRCWGVTGQPYLLGALMEGLRCAAVIQHRDDVMDEGTAEAPAVGRITYGALARAVPAFRQFLAYSPGECVRWSERLGMDVAAESALPRMLLTAALQRNTAGPVLFTTTRPERVALAASAVENPPPSANEPVAFSELVAAVKRALSKSAGKA